MREIISPAFEKLAKSKYPKSETEPYNPWAVCNKSTGGKKKDKAKFERCVQHLKDQNREENKGKKKEERKAAQVQVTQSKPAYEGQVHTPAMEDEMDQDFERSKRNRPVRHQMPRQKTRINPQMSDDDFLKLLYPEKASKPAVAAFVVTAKKKKKDDKWMQDAVKEPGSFTDYCGGDVTEECISRGKKSPNKKTRQRANLADTFRSVSKKNKKD